MAKTVVHSLLDGIHIISKTAHQFSVGMGVEIFQRKLLDMSEKVPADLLYYLLGRTDHQLVIAQGSQGSADIHHSHAAYCPKEPLLISGKDKLVDHRF